MIKKWNKKGMTMAEVLIAVAIIGILCGLGFIGVQRYQASMTQLEYDTIAKEIFIAAQNHIVLAESQGYLGKEGSDFGNEDLVTLDAEGNDIDGDYYIISEYPIETGSMLDQLLPFGSIDETVRQSGSYIIRYQPSSATIMDVFFSRPSDRRGVDVGSLSYADLMDPDKYYGEDRKDARKDIGGKVVGWFGDADALPLGEKLSAPTVRIHNEEKLWIEVTDNNAADSGATTAIIITGKTSGAQCKFIMFETAGRVTGYNDIIGSAVVLDDITTTGCHFCDLEGENGKDFLPGEDIDVEAVAYNNAALTNVAYSGKQKTNSLFKAINNVVSESEELGAIVAPTAQIENFRHLENLDKGISGFAQATCSKDGVVANAVQTAEMMWIEDDTSFQSKIPDLPCVGSVPAKGEVKVYRNTDADVPVTEKGCYSPVDITDYELTYEGNKHAIYNVKVASGETNAGLFGSITGVSIANLELIDFNITGKDTAGALAGAMATSDATNVLARNSGVGAATNKHVTITASEGKAGGLIGNVDHSVITYCAAALSVKGQTHAGGLIGAAQTTSKVVGSYSGGHTLDGLYSEWLRVAAHRDVEGAIAGGLIGDAGNTEITNSYSTCSVKGTTRGGGFAGKASGKIVNCYCTGRVDPDREDDTTLLNNAFVGNTAAESLAVGSSGSFFEIINELPTTDGKSFEYKAGGSNLIQPFDQNIETYNNFVGNNWKEAKPYDKTILDQYYDGKYIFKTVEQLENSEWTSVAKKDNYVRTHYGDWPVAEQFLINR